MKEVNTLKKGYPYLILLRIFVGWHFFYEGIIKAYNPSWTAKGYLLGADGFMNGFFYWLGDDSLIPLVDTLNIAALLFAGFALILGIFERAGAWVGVLLLTFYYLAHPAFPWLDQGVSEGSYWFVNKNLVELAALLVLYQMPTGKYFGIEVFFENRKDIKLEKDEMA